MEPEKKRFFRLGVTLFCSLTAVILFYFILLRVDGVKAYLSVILSALEPLFMGMVLAYLLCPAAKFLERCCERVKGLSRIARQSPFWAALYLRSPCWSCLGR